MEKNCQAELCESKASHVRIEISYGWDVLFDRYFCTKHIDPSYDTLRYIQKYMILKITNDQQYNMYDMLKKTLHRESIKRRHALEIEREIDRERMMKEKRAHTLGDIIVSLPNGK